jgi:multicomponent Na+:H+ antiporter subunit B
MIDIVHIVLFTFLAAVAIAVIVLRNLFAAVMLTGIFSLLSAALFTVMDAVDVAFTEAAVGAGISTILMLGTLSMTASNEKRRYNRPNLLALLVVVLTGAALIYGTLDMPRYGDPEAPIHKDPMAKHFIASTKEEIGVPNMVTAVLASYRGYDTWGETTVIFTAGIGVMMLLGASSVRRKLFPTPKGIPLVEDEPDDRGDKGSGGAS